MAGNAYISDGIVHFAVDYIHVQDTCSGSSNYTLNLNLRTFCAATRERRLQSYIHPANRKDVEQRDYEVQRNPNTSSGSVCKPSKNDSRSSLSMNEHLKNVATFRALASPHSSDSRYFNHPSIRLAPRSNSRNDDCTGAARAASPAFEASVFLAFAALRIRCNSTVQCIIRRPW
jgi:hypothetical protein